MDSFVKAQGESTQLVSGQEGGLGNLEGGGDPGEAQALGTELEELGPGLEGMQKKG